jgi:hypothetical protein
MAILTESGLGRSAEVCFIGINGCESETKSSLQVVKYSEKKHGLHPTILFHGPKATSLLPTMNFLQSWLPGHEDWAVCFFHMKGATHGGRNQLVNNWADCLNHWTIREWRRNIADLESGQFDACGCHWTHNSPQDPNAGNWGENSYFAGVFWWATAKYLLTLPQLPDAPKCRHDWFKPELWLGCGKPRIRDYHPGPVTIHA